MLKIPLRVLFSLFVSVLNVALSGFGCGLVVLVSYEPNLEAETALKCFWVFFVCFF